MVWIRENRPDVLEIIEREAEKKFPRTTNKEYQYLAQVILPASLRNPVVQEASHEDPRALSREQYFGLSPADQQRAIREGRWKK
jgi:hypothetical protein